MAPGAHIAITVHLHTILQRATPAGMERELTLTLPAGSRVADVLAQLEITLPLPALLLVVNGRLVEPEFVLADGQSLHLMPAMAGG